MHHFKTSIMIWSSVFSSQRLLELFYGNRDRHVMTLLSATYVVCQAIPAIVNVFSLCLYCHVVMLFVSLVYMD